MMSRPIRRFVFAVLTSAGVMLAGCAHTDTPMADPEAATLAPPVVIIDDPPPEIDESEPEGEVGISPATLVKDPETEVITFVGADADPGMSDEVTGSPTRKPLPSMMSDVLHGPNK